jgi:histidine ammonia-lyase
LAIVRAEIPSLSEDRVLAGDLEKAAEMVRTGRFLDVGR